MPQAFADPVSLYGYCSCITPRAAHMPSVHVCSASHSCRAQDMCSSSDAMTSELANWLGKVPYYSVRAQELCFASHSPRRQALLLYESYHRSPRSPIHANGYCNSITLLVGQRRLSISALRVVTLAIRKDPFCTCHYPFRGNFFCTSH